MRNVELHVPPNGGTPCITFTEAVTIYPSDICPPGTDPATALKAMETLVGYLRENKNARWSWVVRKRRSMQGETR